MGIGAAVVLSIWAAALDSVVSQIIVQEVGAGEIAILPCPSNDDQHRFQFWQLNGDTILGPGNTFNERKYRYEVLTGTLYIKSVSTAESGFYKCVSKTLTGTAFNVQGIELIVKKDWEEVYETDYETNIYRVVIAIATIILLLGLAFFAYKLIRRRRSSRFRDISDEESPDEAPSQVGTFNVSNLPPMTTHVAAAQGIDNPGLDTDFPRVYKQTTSDSRM